MGNAIQLERTISNQRAKIHAEDCHVLLLAVYGKCNTTRTIINQRDQTRAEDCRVLLLAVYGKCNTTRTIINQRAQTRAEDCRVLLLAVYGKCNSKWRIIKFPYLHPVSGLWSSIFKPRPTIQQFHQNLFISFWLIQWTDCLDMAKKQPASLIVVTRTILAWYQLMMNLLLGLRAL